MTGYDWSRHCIYLNEYYSVLVVQYDVIVYMTGYDAIVYIFGFDGIVYMTGIVLGTL